ncbi:MAG: class I SAM-dependent RNA methyltransferase [Clostridiales bacterium]|nr:class I SAM-dependent RNA methyltransferase [Candidatus Crickella caballi]
MKLELIATATFGLEAVVKREIEKLGYRILKTEDGRVTYLGDERAVVRSNLWLRTADRIYVKMGEFEAYSFEELFQQTKAIEWESIIPMDGKFPVVGTSVKSELHSVPSCQSIIKKAVVTRLGEFYMSDKMQGKDFTGSLQEDGAEYRIRFAALKNKFVLMLDASGIGLHKRGYRVKDVEAPMKETLAAALVQLSFYRADRPLVDLTCGSGTILIEAAMIERNIAPGLNRGFASEGWDIIPEEMWKEERKAAYAAADFSRELNIKGFDINRKAIEAATANADEAGLLDDMELLRMDMKKFEPDCRYGVVISNLPYGKRVGTDPEIEAIYKRIGYLMRAHPTWSFFLITSDKELEKQLNISADRRRKLYNGNIETTYYQFHGTRPPKKETV